MLGNAEQAEDSTDLFEVEFAANCYFYRPVGTSPDDSRAVKLDLGMKACVASYSASGSYAAGATWMRMPRTPSISKKKAVTGEADGISTRMVAADAAEGALGLFHPITAEWFRAVFDAPTCAAGGGLAGDRARRVTR